MVSSTSNKAITSKSFTAWSSAAAFSVSLAFWFLMNVALFQMLVFSVVTGSLLTICLARARQFVLTRDWKRLSISAVPAAAFLLQLPVSGLVHIDKLYHLVIAWSFPTQLCLLINIAENLFIAGAVFAFVYLVILLVWSLVLQRPFIPTVPGKKVTAFQRFLKILLYASPCLLVWAFFLFAYWPGILTPDSFAQWSQIESLKLSDWNPVGHTLLEYLITRLWFSPAAVAIFQVLAMAFVWGWALSYLEDRGIHKVVLITASAIFALLPYNGIMLVTLWKDIPYAIVNMILVLLIGMIWHSEGQWLSPVWNRVILGIALGAAYLMRHNGLVLLVALPPALLIFFPRRWKAVLVSAAAAFVLVFLVRNVLAFGILKAQPNRDAVLYVLPVQHIAAVIYNGGEYNGINQKVMEKIAPIPMWKKAYNPIYADTISKPWGYLKDPLVLDKIEQNGPDILSTFIDVTIANPKIVMNSELIMTNRLWQITRPEGYGAYDYSFTTEIPADTRDPKLFAQPNLTSRIKKHLDKTIVWIHDNPVADVVFWRDGLTLFLSIILAAFLFVDKGRRSLLLFIPAAANLLSLVVSIPVQDFRYIYPIVLPFILLVLMGWAGASCPDRGDLPLKVK